MFQIVIRDDMQKLQYYCALNDLPHPIFGVLIVYNRPYTNIRFVSTCTVGVLEEIGEIKDTTREAKLSAARKMLQHYRPPAG